MIAPAMSSWVAAFDAFQPRRGVDLHDQRAILAFQQVHTGHPQPHDLGRPHGGLLVYVVQLHRFGQAAPMHIAAEFLALGHAPHGRHHLIAHDKGPDVLAFALGHKFLDQNVLLLALQQFDDRLGRFDRLGQQHADALGAFQQFDDDRRAAHPLDGGQHILFVPHKSGLGDADQVAAEDLQAAQFVPGVGDARGGVGAKDIHLLELAHDRRAVIGDGRADAGQHRVVVGELLLAEVEVRLALVQIDGEFEGVQHFDVMSPLHRGFAQTPGAVALGAA